MIDTQQVMIEDVDESMLMGLKKTEYPKCLLGNDGFEISEDWIGVFSGLSTL